MDSSIEQPKDIDKEKKPIVDIPTKSSMEILSELFNSFDAEPPLIIKKEKSSSPVKKSKKSKKKHKHHKDKKHKKKEKKRKRNHSTSSEKSEIDLAEILIKQEKESSNKKVKIEGTNLSIPINENGMKKEIEVKKIDLKIEKSNSNSNNKKSKKIEIKLKTTDLKSKHEDGELPHSDESSNEIKRKKRKHKSERDKLKKKVRRSKSKERTKEIKEKTITSDDLRNKIKSHHSKNSRSPVRDDHYNKSNDFYKSKDKDDYYKTKDRDRSRDRSRERRSKDRDRYKDSDYKSRKRDNPFYREEESDRETKRGRDKYRSSYDRDREKRHRDRSNSRESSHIDKKKLLEIARRNAIQMMKSGSLPGALTLGPQAQEKVIAAIKAGGKTIEELTDFCKTLSKKEELGDLSSNSDENGSDSDADVPFHHPFQIKDRPTSITMNIKNSVPLPLKSTQERSSELRMQFPVSSGQLHRKTESEWVPVSPKKAEIVQPAPPPPPPPKVINTGPLAIEAPPVISPPQPSPQLAVVPLNTVPPGPQLFPSETNQISVDIGSIVSERLAAMRKLQENPNDVEALTKMYKSNKEMQTWAASKQQPGQFTGTTGAQILSQAELSSGYQAWAKKDQLQSATPVSGGMGMHLLQKMGWKPGEGLGKEKSGALEPLLLEVKLDKKGLVANEEQRRKKKQPQTWNPKSLQNKHPVSLLGEYASKKKLGAPQYNLCFECGPDHKKNFLFEVVLNGVQYKPNVASPNKKEAKAMAASVCLQHLGLLPSVPQ